MPRQYSHSDEYFLPPYANNPFGWFKRRRRTPRVTTCQWVEPAYQGSPRYAYCNKRVKANNLCEYHLDAWEYEQKLHRLRQRYKREGYDPDSPNYGHYKENPIQDDEYRHLKQLEPWQMTINQFIDVLNFGSGKKWLQAYDTPTIESFRWAKASSKPIIVATKQFNTQFGPREIDFRQSGVKNRYVKKGSDGEHLRDISGNLVYYTDEEILSKGWALYEICIYAFDEEQCIGHISDEYGGTLLVIAEEYQRCGIGQFIYRLFWEKHPYRCAGGFTDEGYRFVKRVHKKYVMEALEQGLPIPPEVMENYV